jgi:hypothetical protein
MPEDQGVDSTLLAEMFETIERDSIPLHRVILVLLLPLSDVLRVVLMHETHMIVHSPNGPLTAPTDHSFPPWTSRARICHD